MSVNDQKREDIKKGIDLVVSAKEKELADYRVKLDAATMAADVAHGEAAKCYEATDIKGYHKAQDEYRASNDATDMFRNKIANMEKEPYISEAEFQQAANTIYEELNDEVEVAGAEIADLVKQIMAISERTSASINKWEQYVLDVQKNVRKDNCHIITSAGVDTDVTDSARLKRFNNKKVFSYVEHVRNHPFINKYLGEIPKEFVEWGTAR